jgi:hypothetical protein
MVRAEEQSSCLTNFEARQSLMAILLVCFFIRGRNVMNLDLVNSQPYKHH